MWAFFFCIGEYALFEIIPFKMYKMQTNCSHGVPCSTRDLIPSQWAESESTLYVWMTRENRMEIFRILSATLLALLYSWRIMKGITLIVRGQES